MAWRKHKYNAKKQYAWPNNPTLYDSRAEALEARQGHDKTGLIVFDSKLEAKRYTQLLLLVQSGQIRNLSFHPKFTLQPKFALLGIKHRAITYAADFQYKERRGERWVTIIEDVKGQRTKEFNRNEKMLLYKLRDKIAHGELEFRVLTRKEI